MTGSEFLQFVAGKRDELLIRGVRPVLLRVEWMNLYDKPVPVYLVRLPIRVPEAWKGVENPDYWLTDVSGLELDDCREHLAWDYQKGLVWTAEKS